MSAQELESAMAALRRRARMLGIAAALLWALAAGLAVIAAWAWIDLLADPPGWVRVAGFGLAIICSIAVLAAHLRSTAAACRKETLARRLDRSAGAGGQILTGIDLLEMPDTNPLTQGLATLAVDRASALAAKASLASAAPAKPMLRALATFSCILLAIALLSLLLPNIVRAQWNRFSDPFGDHTPYSRLQIHVQPGNVDVVYGGALDIRATVENGAVDHLETVLLPERPAAAEKPGDTEREEVIPMFAEPDGTWRTALANVTAGGKYFVRARQARSDKFSLKIVTVPKITAVTVRVTLPPYTRQPAFDGAVPPGGLNVLAGSEVEFHAHSNRPLAAGNLEITAPAGLRQVAMKPAGSADQASEVRGAFKIDQAGKITIHVKDTAGQDSIDVFATALTLLADERPFVRIIEPRSQSYATPDAKVPVELMGEDDYGITSLTLYRSLNDSRALGIDLPVPSTFPTRHRAAATLALARLGLHPGDVIKITGRAEDNDPAGAKGSESEPTTIQIISQEDYQRMMVARAGLEVLLSKYQQAQRRLEHTEAALRKMKDDLAKEKPDPLLTKEQKKQNDDTADDADDAAGEVARAHDMALPFDIDRSLTPHLDRIAKRLEHVAGKLRENDPAARTVKDQIAILDQLIGGVDDEEKAFAQDTLEPLEYLAKLFPLIADQEKFLQIYKRQLAVVERLKLMPEEHPDAKQKARLRDMEQEQKQLHTTLTALIEAIESHAAELPDDPEIDDFRKTAEDFARDLKNTDIDDHMIYAERAMGDFWVGTARTETAEIIAIMKKFIDEIDGGGGMGAQGKIALKFKPVLAKNLGDTVAQLLGAAGLGSGGGEGYSSAGNDADADVYGNLPLALKGNGGGDEKTRGAGVGGASSTDSQGGTMVAGSVKKTAGASAIPVPAQYRRRVDQYFQRVADEIKE